MSGQIIRVLYGNLDNYPKLRREAIASLRYGWSRENAIHYVLGKANADMLVKHKAKKVILLNDHRNIAPKNTNLFYNKVWLINQAMKDHPEILFVDFDCNPIRKPDEKMWEILRARGGRFNGVFQAPCVGYVNPFVYDFYHLRNFKQRYLISVCLVYCSDPTWTADWFTHYADLCKKLKSARGVMDETGLIFMLDTKYGLLSRKELIDHFEIPIGLNNRSLPEAKALKKKEIIYFRHR